MVDVFGGGALQKRFIAGYFVFNALQAVERVANFDLGEDADLLQSFGPRAVHGELVRQESAVERERTLERVELFVGFALEAAAPKAVVFACGCRLVGHGHGALLAETGRRRPAPQQRLASFFRFLPLLSGGPSRVARTD